MPVLQWIRKKLLWSLLKMSPETSQNGQLKCSTNETPGKYPYFDGWLLLYRRLENKFQGYLFRQDVFGIVTNWSIKVERRPVFANTCQVFCYHKYCLRCIALRSVNTDDIERKQSNFQNIGVEKNYYFLPPAKPPNSQTVGTFDFSEFVDLVNRRAQIFRL